MNFLCRICLLCFCLGPLMASEDVYSLIPIKAIGPERLESLKSEPGLYWWVELDDQLLVESNDQTFARLKSTWRAAEVRREADQGTLSFVYLGAEALPRNTQILAQSGRLAVARFKSTGLSSDTNDVLCRHGHTRLAPFVPNTILLGDGVNHAVPAQARDAQVQELVDMVDPDRWFADVTTLAGYNRYSRGSEILDARDWLVGQFSALPHLTVTTPSFTFGGTVGYNVIATLTGTTRPDDIYIVGAHYDAISENSPVAAPGAEDNGSGTAAVLEMARIFSAVGTEATVLFICYSGEEQGLYGSAAHAASMVTQGIQNNMKAALIMDMIGFSQSPTNLKVLLETSQDHGGFLLEPMIQAASQYTSIGTVTSLNPFGSDHIPYIQRGMPALLTIENDWDNYGSYHRSTDLPANVRTSMGSGIIRLNVATLAGLAGLTGQSEATVNQYYAFWQEEIQAQFHDLNQNGLVDVIDILDRLTRP